MKYTVVLTHIDPTIFGNFKAEYTLLQSWKLNFPLNSVMYMFLLVSGYDRYRVTAELVSEPMLGYMFDSLLENEVPLIKEVAAIMKTGKGEDDLLKAIRELNKFRLPPNVPPYLNGTSFEDSLG